MEIVIINIYDALEGENYYSRGRTLYNKLKHERFNVKWWASRYVHHAKKFRTNKDNNIILFNTVSYKNHVSLMRLLNYTILAVQMNLKILSTQSNTVYIVSTPFPVFDILFCLLNNRNRARKLILEFRDFWPEAWLKNVRINYIVKQLYALFLYYRNQFIRSSDVCISANKNYSNRIKKITCSKFVQHKYAYPLNDTIKYFNIKNVNLPTKKKGSIWYVAVGASGMQHDFETVLEVFIKLSNNKLNNKYFITCNEETFNEYKDQSTNNLHILNYVNIDEYSYLLKHSDVGLMLYSKNTDVSFPEKFSDYIQNNIISINNLTGECYDIIKKYEIGINIKNNLSHKDNCIKAINLLEDKIDYYNGQINKMKHKFTNDAQIKIYLDSLR